MYRELIIELTALLAVVITVVACIVGFIRGLKARKEIQEEPKVESKPRDPKTGRYVKKEDKK